MGRDFAGRLPEFRDSSACCYYVLSAYVSNRCRFGICLAVQRIEWLKDYSSGKIVGNHSYALFYENILPHFRPRTELYITYMI